MYLLEETLDAIEESGHTTDDVLYVGSEDGRLQLPWGQAEPVLRVHYDNGYGDQEIATDLCIRFTDGAMLVRCEYDGAEWWRPIPAPAPQGDAFDCVKSDSSMNGRCLAGLNESCEEHFQFGMVGVWVTSIGNT